MHEAFKARNNSYAPYSEAHIGAAILAADDQIFTGANVENASYGLSLCAERVAAVKAITAKSQNWKAIAISFDGTPSPPCGACCQFLSEFNSGNLIIAYGKNENSFNIIKLKNLFPKPFKVYKRR